ncbi:MAG: glycosyltransferase [Acidobacteriia bacterium]|nr:glycosyltransferase [Terriglobia bacterium]
MESTPQTHPRVSVVIPTFNRAAFLPAATRSALNQTLHALEVIIVDDGSTDATPEVCRSLAASDPRIRAFRQANRGLAAARNAGLAAAAADWIAFLDDDDLWVGTALEVFIRHARASSALLVSHARGFTSPTPDVTAEAVLADPARYAVAPWPPDPPGTRIELGELLLRPLFPPNAALVRVQALKELGGFNEARRAAEDYEVWLKLVARNPIPVIGEPLALYRWHPGQMSATLARQAGETRLVLEAFLARHPEGWAAAGRSRLRRRLALLAREEAYAALLVGDRGTAFRAAWCSIAWSFAQPKSWLYLLSAAAPGLYLALRGRRRRRR